MTVQYEMGSNFPRPEVLTTDCCVLITDYWLNRRDFDNTKCDSMTRNRISRPPRWWIWLAGAGLLVALSSGGWFVFQNQRRHMYLRNGREALARSAIEDALFFSAKAFKADPQGVDANRLMADALAAAKAPESVFWRARVATLEPAKIENYLTWAQAALDAGRSDWAGEALSKAPKEAENRADWQNLMGGAQTNLGQLGEAEQHFERAIEIEPANSLYAVNLASLRLSYTDPAVVARARQELRQLSASKTGGRFALEALTREALHQRDLENARLYSSELEERSDQNWGDRLLELETVFQTTGFKNRLADLQQKSLSDLGNRIALVYWMIGHGLAKDVTEWITERGKSVPVPLQMALADAYGAQQDWPNLRDMLEPVDWAANDFLRKALLARCERNESTFQDRWQEALRSAQGDPQKRFRLGQLASGWGWYDEASQLLWSVADTSPILHSSALGELWRIGVLEKNTAAMLKVAAARYHDNPESAGTKNNYAFLLLLLGLDASRAQLLAKEAWAAAPLQPDVASTYAFACYKQGRTEDGIKAMEQLAENYRSEPWIALYYAALLADEGHSEEAARYLAHSDGSPRLLPEEQALVTEIKSKIGQR
jgi:Flp pilus assembly protein TadD